MSKLNFGFGTTPLPARARGAREPLLTQPVAHPLSRSWPSHIIGIKNSSKPGYVTLILHNNCDYDVMPKHKDYYWVGQRVKVQTFERRGPNGEDEHEITPL